VRRLDTRFVGSWALALLVTVAAAYYQRKTGPTYPVSQTVTLGGEEITVLLERAHPGAGDQPVTVSTDDTTVSGELFWRRYPTNEEFTAASMEYEDGRLIAYMPHQPPAGKLEYRLRLRRGSETVAVPARGTVVTRFRGAVPAYFLIPHILFMFFAMTYSNRAGIEAVFREGRLRYYTQVTVLLLCVGGMILGPIVQKYAFGAFWTGVPFGHDLTDNKTLVAFVGWLIALVRVRKNPQSRSWVLGAALLTLVVFLIPHSLLGSELKYE